MKILFAAGDPKPERWTTPLQALLPDAEVFTWDPNGAPVGAEYAIVWQPPAALFDREPGLKAVFNLGAGVDALLAMANLPPALPVVRVEDAGMAVQMAEYVLHQLLDASRDMAAYRAQQQSGSWRLRRPVRRQDWPVGIMGLGHIGQRVAQTIAALEYPVHGWARTPRTLDGVTTWAGDDQLPTFLNHTRVLVNTLPLTDQTRDLIDYQLLSQLRPEAVMINVGRGEHLVEDDLLRALDDGLVARAALDVFRTEPLPPEHPFWQRPEITVTPHMSARSLREATLAQIARKIRDHARGRPISGIVDRSRGY